jgi:hypothetical protein
VISGGDMMNNEKGKAKEKESENLQYLEKKVVRYVYEDGTVEISIGIMFLFLGLILFLYWAMLFHPLYAIIFVLTCAGIMFAASIWLLPKLKGKFVWSKTGYYKARGSYPKSFWVFIILSILSVAFAVFSVRLFPAEVAIALFGGCFFFGFISQFYQAGKIRRFFYISFIPLFATGVCLLLDISWKQSIVVMFLATGLTFLVSGIIVYEQFKRKSTE